MVWLLVCIGTATASGTGSNCDGFDNQFLALKANATLHDACMNVTQTQATSIGFANATLFADVLHNVIELGQTSVMGYRVYNHTHVVGFQVYTMYLINAASRMSATLQNSCDQPHTYKIRVANLRASKTISCDPRRGVVVH